MFIQHLCPVPTGVSTWKCLFQINLEDHSPSKQAFYNFTAFRCPHYLALSPSSMGNVYVFCISIFQNTQENPRNITVQKRFVIWILKWYDIHYVIFLLGSFYLIQWETCHEHPSYCWSCKNSTYIYKGIHHKCKSESIHCNHHLYFKEQNVVSVKAHHGHTCLWLSKWNFITHCSEGEHTVWCLSKGVFKKTYRMWASFRWLGEGLKKHALLWIRCYQEEGVSEILSMVGEMKRD